MSCIVESAQENDSSPHRWSRVPKPPILRRPLPCIAYPPPFSNFVQAPPLHTALFVPLFL